MPSPHIVFVLHLIHDLSTDKPFKFSPGFWLVEKNGGMLVGGVDPHRFDISSMTMLKGNHIVSASRTYHHSVSLTIPSSHHDYGAGSIIAAIEPARKVGDFLLLLNVRVRGKGGANEAIAGWHRYRHAQQHRGSELASIALREGERWMGEREVPALDEPRRYRK
jgi:nicotinate-nucleotide pyrophosphorylase (carboxylating)